METSGYGTIESRSLYAWDIVEPHKGTLLTALKGNDSWSFEWTVAEGRLAADTVASYLSENVSFSASEGIHSASQYRSSEGLETDASVDGKGSQEDDTSMNVLMFRWPGGAVNGV